MTGGVAQELSPLLTSVSKGPAPTHEQISAGRASPLDIMRVMSLRTRLASLP